MHAFTHIRTCSHEQTLFSFKYEKVPLWIHTYLLIIKTTLSKLTNFIWSFQIKTVFPRIQYEVGIGYLYHYQIFSQANLLLELLLPSIDVFITNIVWFSIDKNKWLNLYSIKGQTEVILEKYKRDIKISLTTLSTEYLVIKFGEKNSTYKQKLVEKNQ